MSTELRRKRVNDDGEWEYECSGCGVWNEKIKFRGCVRFTDPYGNCMLCSSCRAKQTKSSQKLSDEVAAQHILKMIGFYNYESSDDWYKAKLQENKRDQPDRKNNRGMKPTS